MLIKLSLGTYKKNLDTFCCNFLEYKYKNYELIIIYINFQIESDYLVCPNNMWLDYRRVYCRYIKIIRYLYNTYTNIEINLFFNYLHFLIYLNIYVPTFSL